MSYLIKNKKYTFMIIFFISFFFFIGNADALVYKDRVNSQFVASTKQGYFVTQNTSSGLPYYIEQWVNFDFTDNFPVQNSDYILFQFVREEYNLFEGENNFCSEYIQRPNSSSNIMSTITCNPDTYHNSYNIDNNLNKSMFIKYNDNSIDYCWFDSTMQGYAVCPNSKKPITSFWMHYTGTYRRVEYRLQVSTIIYLYNNESTEIITALGGVSTNVSATTSAIEAQTQQQAQQNAYVQNSNISQAQTNTSDNITVLNDQLTAELSQFSDLTQLVVAPITMFMELNNNVCAPLTLQIPFVNQTAVLPCIKPIMTQYFGAMYSVFTTVIGAILCYWTFIRTVSLIKDLIDADNDKIEVVDL